MCGLGLCQCLDYRYAKAEDNLPSNSWIITLLDFLPLRTWILPPFSSLENLPGYAFFILLLVLYSLPVAHLPSDASRADYYPKWQAPMPPPLFCCPLWYSTV